MESSTKEQSTAKVQDQVQHQGKQGPANSLAGSANSPEEPCTQSATTSLPPAHPSLPPRPDIIVQPSISQPFPSPTRPRPIQAEATRLPPSQPTPYTRQQSQSSDTGPGVSRRSRRNTQRRRSLRRTASLRLRDSVRSASPPSSSLSAYPPAFHSQHSAGTAATAPATYPNTIPLGHSRAMRAARNARGPHQGRGDAGASIMRGRLEHVIREADELARLRQHQERIIREAENRYYEATQGFRPGQQRGPNQNKPGQ